MAHGSVESRDEVAGSKFKVEDSGSEFGVFGSGLSEAGYKERAKRTRFGLSALGSGLSAASYRESRRTN
jgi:hypothetical protein